MTPPRTTSASPGITVHNRLLSVAKELFSRKGYSATTTREIVAAAGVTKPVLYYYFRNKEGIYLELMRSAFAKLEALIDASSGKRGTASKRLLRLSDQTFSLLMENMEVAKLMYSIYYGPSQGAPFFNFDAYHLKFQDAIRKFVKEGIHQREFQKGNVEDIVWAILGAVNVTLEVQLSHPEKAIGRKGLARILNLILRGFQKEGK